MELPDGQALATTPCSAIVTRYPTGVFGISYRGSMFFWWGFSERETQRKLLELRVPPEETEWREHFYDRRYEFHDPRCYQARRYYPQNAKAQPPA